MQAPRGICFVSLVLGFAFALALAAPASAAPVMCTSDGSKTVDPQGITATHLLVKLGGNWVEPQNVCVGARVEEATEPNGRIDRGLYWGVWNTVDGGFPETHLPTGTPISLGLHFPDGMLLQNTFARARDVVVITQGSYTVIQGKTVPWDYHAEAYFGGPGLDCSKPPTTWPSTFSAYSSLNSLNADRTPDTSSPFAGGFYDSNTVGALFPNLVLDANGNPAGLQVAVSGCGDNDPSTLEGYFNGFTPISVFHAVGITDQLLNDVSLLQGMLEVQDLTTGNTISAKFEPVGPGSLALEPIPGVTMPPAPGGTGLIGVRTQSEFSYSEHQLLQRAAPSALAALRECRAKGGTPAPANAQLTCSGVTTAPPSSFQAKLTAPRSLNHERAVSVYCNRACGATATIVAHGTRLASGRARSTIAGSLKVRLKLTAAGRRQLKSAGSVRATLSVVVSDLQGSRLRLHRTVPLIR